MALECITNCKYANETGYMCRVHIFRLHIEFMQMTVQLELAELE